MAGTLVGHQVQSFAAGNQMTVSYTPSKAGNLLVAFVTVEYYSGHIPTNFTPITITDSSGNTWIQDAVKDTQALNGSYQSGTVGFHTSAIGPSPFLFTAKLNTADLTGQMSIAILEFSGVGTSPVIVTSYTGQSNIALNSSTTQVVPAGYLVVQFAAMANTNGNTDNTSGPILLVDSIAGGALNTPGMIDGYFFSAGGSQTWGFTSNTNGQANTWISLVFPAPITPTVPVPTLQAAVSFPSVDPTAQIPGGMAVKDCGIHVGRVPFDFSLNTTYNFDLQQLPQAKLRGIKTVYCDSADQINPVTIVSEDTQQKLVILPRTQGYYPFQSGSGRFIVTCAAGQAGLPFVMVLFDRDVEPLVWSANPSGAPTPVSVSGTLTALVPAQSTGGALPYNYLNVPGSSNQDSNTVKVGSTILYGVQVSNIAGSNAAARFVKLYDKGSNPTSSDNPFLIIGIPAPPGSPPISLSFPGIQCNFGLGHRITTGIAYNDANGSVAGDQTCINLWYK